MPFSMLFRNSIVPIRNNAHRSATQIGYTAMGILHPRMPQTPLIKEKNGKKHIFDRIEQLDYAKYSD